MLSKGFLRCAKKGDFIYCQLGSTGVKTLQTDGTEESILHRTLPSGAHRFQVTYPNGLKMQNKFKLPGYEARRIPYLTKFTHIRWTPTGIRVERGSCGTQLAKGPIRRGTCLSK